MTQNKLFIKLLHYPFYNVTLETNKMLKKTFITSHVVKLSILVIKLCRNLVLLEFDVYCSE